MSVGSTTALALSALLRNRMRSVLTMLGVVIGVAAVLMMESLGQGATAYIGETISGMGSNMLMVVPGPAKMLLVAVRLKPAGSFMARTKVPDDLLLTMVLFTT